MSRGPAYPPVEKKRQVIARDGGFCLLALHRCQGEATTTDHRANRGSGGSIALNHGGNLIAACAICNGDKADARGRVRSDLIERGLLVIPDSTHAKTLDRALSTPIQDLAGDWWMLLSATERRPATRLELERHVAAVAA